MDLQELSQWMKARNLKGHWEHSEWSQSVKPYLWKGDEIMQALNWSGELITTGEAGRRTIQMRNPGLSAGMTNTVHISVQLVKPGEVAAAHRHTAAAVRFIVKGTPNAYTDRRGRTFPDVRGRFYHARRIGPGTITSIMPANRSCGSTVWMFDWSRISAP